MLLKFFFSVKNNQRHSRVLIYNLYVENPLKEILKAFSAVVLLTFIFTSSALDHLLLLKTKIRFIETFQFWLVFNKDEEV